MTVSIDRLVDIPVETGESPVWSPAEACLWWVDITGRTLYRTDPATATTAGHPIGEEIGCIALARSGRLICGLRAGFAVFDPATATLTRLDQPEAARPDMRFNDGCTDPAGRFIAGTMSMGPPPPDPPGRLYALHHGRPPRLLFDGFRTINGLAFSPDGRRMYLSDSHPDIRTIWACDYDAASGEPGARQVFFDSRAVAGRPDGGAVDADGCYWMAGIGGAQLVRLTPAGAIDRMIELPFPTPTKIAFGGAGLDTMFVTSLVRGAFPDDRARGGGGLYAVRAGVAGWLPPAFAD